MSVFLFTVAAFIVNIVSAVTVSCILQFINSSKFSGKSSLLVIARLRITAAQNFKTFKYGFSLIGRKGHIVYFKVNWKSENLNNMHTIVV